MSLYNWKEKIHLRTQASVALGKTKTECGEGERGEAPTLYDTPLTDNPLYPPSQVCQNCVQKRKAK